MNLFDTDMQRSATFSPCRTWRYSLYRCWDEALPTIAFIGLNPSVADEVNSDNTVTRDINFAKSWGFGSLWKFNLFGYCATEHLVMKAAADPIGPETDEYLIRRCREVASSDGGMVLACWGRRSKFPKHLKDRDKIVFKTVPPGRLFCLGLNNDGTPKHPLYIAGRTKPVPLIFPGSLQ